MSAKPTRYSRPIWMQTSEPKQIRRFDELVRLLKRLAPVIFADTTEKLESIILQRIKDKVLVEMVLNVMAIIL